MLAAFSLNWFLKQVQDPWVVFGFGAQFVFFMRFAVQWFVSERRGRSHIPVAFWWLSIVGGLMTLVYAIKIESLPFMAAQVLSVAIYVRNLMLIYRPRRRRGLPISDSAGASGLDPGDDSARSSSV